MTNVRCPSCATIWNVGNPGAAQIPAGVKQAQAESESTSGDDGSGNTAVIIVSLVCGAMFLIAIVGIGILILSRTPDPSVVAQQQQQEETIKPRVPEDYRVIRLPEATRRRIYDDYRKVARTTVETPLPLPENWRIREGLEDTLEKTFERELMRFAALHDITVDDVKEVIKEGDAKQWDTSPRSNAVRDGKRVYSEEMSEGWEMEED